MLLLRASITNIEHVWDFMAHKAIDLPRSPKASDEFLSLL